MKIKFLFLLMLILAIILQFLITGWANRRVVDFFLILVIFWSYFRGWKGGVLAGFFSGLAEDILFFPVVGINAFSLSLIGFLISEAKSRIYQENVVFFTLMVGIAFLINNFVVASWLLLFHQLPLIPTFTDSLYPSLLYTCALCSLIFFIGGKQTKLSIPQS